MLIKLYRKIAPPVRAIQLHANNRNEVEKFIYEGCSGIPHFTYGTKGELEFVIHSAKRTLRIGSWCGIKDDRSVHLFTDETFNLKYKELN